MRFRWTERQNGGVQVSRSEVAEVAEGVLLGRLTREAAALWAGKRHVVEHTDPVVEHALDVLTGIDQQQVSADMEPIGYLFDLEDLKRVRAELANDASA